MSTKLNQKKGKAQATNPSPLPVINPQQKKYMTETETETDSVDDSAFENAVKNQAQ